MRLKTLLAATLICSGYVFGPAHADAAYDRCEKAAIAKTAVDSNLAPCGVELLQREELKLKLAWKKALQEVDGSKSEQGSALLDEQRAWIFFKDKACHQYDLIQAGTLGRYHDAYVCRALIIEDRILELGGLRGQGLG